MNDTGFLKYFLIFYYCIVHIGISPLGNLDCVPWAKPAAQPTGPAGCFSVSIIHGTLTWTTGSLNLRTDVNACGCIQGGVRTP